MAKEINLFDHEIETIPEDLSPQDLSPQDLSQKLLPQDEMTKSSPQGDLNLAKPSELPWKNTATNQSSLPEGLADAELQKQKPRSEQPSLPGILDGIQTAQRAQQQEKFIKQHAKRIVEALLFSSHEPLPFAKIREITDSFHPLKPTQLRNIILELQQDYLSQQRAFRLEEIAQGYLLRTCEEYSPFIDALFRNKRTEKLTQSSAEVLAIIAYRQPITRPQIEAIRGVDSSGVMQNLLERHLIEPVGRLEAPGRPNLYGITKEFLTHYGLKDLQDLPTLPNQSSK